MKNKFILWFLLFFNRQLTNRGQNAFCYKKDIIFEILQLQYKYRDSLKIKRDLLELQKIVDNLNL